jgi:hypothetical protein
MPGPPAPKFKIKGRATRLCPRATRERYNRGVSRKRKTEMGYCAYCGEWRELTRDHVPPLSLFGRPRPSDLITVPSCYFCNHGASMEDEYFNFVLKLGIDQNRFPNENADSVDKIMTLARPESLGFARYLSQKYQRNSSRFEVDRDRVGIVLRRIVRGLFYRDIGMRLPEFVPFQFVSIEDQPRKAAALSGVTDSLARSQQEIGRGVFRYAFAQCALPDPFVTAWLLSFYDHRRFFCFTSNPL